MPLRDSSLKWTSTSTQSANLKFSIVEMTLRNIRVASSVCKNRAAWTTIHENWHAAVDMIWEPGFSIRLISSSGGRGLLGRGRQAISGGKKSALVRVSWSTGSNYEPKTFGRKRISVSLGDSISLEIHKTQDGTSRRPLHQSLEVLWAFHQLRVRWQKSHLELWRRHIATGEPRNCSIMI